MISKMQKPDGPKKYARVLFSGVKLLNFIFSDFGSVLPIAEGPLVGGMVANLNFSQCVSSRGHETTLVGPGSAISVKVAGAPWTHW